jgi:streptogramin lyase
MAKNISFAVAGLTAVLLCLFAATGLHAQSAVALDGVVSSAREGAMEGVLVSAKRAGSIVTVTVVSDEHGRYHFPAAKFPAGTYQISTRAAGYDLDGPSSVTYNGVASSANLRLKPTADLGAQLSNAEWIASMPGSDDMKGQVTDCGTCHTLQRVVNSHYTADQFIPLVQRMFSYTNNTTPLVPQPRPDGRRPNDPGALRPFAEFLASINLSSGARTYALKPFPRPTGRATHVVITEYDLPRKQIAPHDVIVDRNGTVWYSDFVEQYIGKLDPATLKVTEYPIPLLKPNFPKGGLDLEPDRAGNLWLGMMHQGGVAKLDPTTGTVSEIAIPAQWNNDSTQQSFVTAPGADGKMWIKDTGSATILRYDLASGTWDRFGPVKRGDRPIGFYGVNADPENNGYGLDFTPGTGQDIVKVDAHTGAITIFPTPTQVSRPRRGRFDAQGRLWFAEWGTNRVGMLDPSSGKMTEWVMPTPWMQPYDAVLDKNGDVWTGSMLNDRVVRINPKTGAMIAYLLPHETNIRRVFVDNSTTPVTFWTGNNNSATIVRVEPGD